MSYSIKDEQARLQCLLAAYVRDFPDDTKTELLCRQQGLLLGMLALHAHKDWQISRDISQRLEDQGYDPDTRPLKNLTVKKKS